MTPFQIAIGSWTWLVSETTMERLGWMLLHTLWQFLLIAILALTLLRVLSRSSASWRYAILVCSMAGCVVVPIVTWCSLQADPVRVATPVQTNAIEPVPLASMPSQPGSSNQTTIASDGPGVAAELAAVNEQPLVDGSQSFAESIHWWMNARDDLRPWLMTIVTVWILGVMICAVRPLLSWMAIRRWRRVGTSPVNQEVTAMMLRLTARLGVRRKVEILKSQLVHVPLVFGYLRPVILLPASLLTNLPTAQLEAIIAHELAHVRRHDFLVNFIQTIIETLFFYHPAIWWLSHRVRIERENCCDDLVVSVLCNRVEYGKALLAVEESPGLARSLALGARDGSLLARVQRLAGLEAARRGPIASVAAMIASTLLIAGTAFMIGNLLLAASDDNETQFGKESNGLQIRLLPLVPEVSDDSPDLQKLASSFKRSEDVTFAVQIKNVSRQPISLAGIRYGDGYAAETIGKLNTAMLAPHWFEFEFTDSEGKRLPRTPHREFYKGWNSADNCSVHVLAPGESLIEVLRPAKFMEPMNYDLSPGTYRVQVNYRGPNDSLREFVSKHWPDKPILNAWPHQATSNVSDFAIEEASNRIKPDELIWGKPVEGLQAAIEYRLPDGAKGNPLSAPGIAVGTPLGLTFHLRNVSDKPITFVSETGRQGDQVHVTDDSGKEVEVKDAFYTGWPIDVAWKLMPGEVAQLRLLTPGLGSLDKPGKYKVRYTIRFNSRGQNDEAGNVIFPRPGDYDKEVDTGEAPLFLHEAKSDISANGANQSDGTLLDGSLHDQIDLKLTREVAHQGNWYFVDLDQGKLRTPPFEVDIDATRFPFFVTKPSEEELSDWLRRDGVDLILRSSIYRPDPKGPIERNEIQVRSVRTLLKVLPHALEKADTNSPAWKQTLEEDVLDVFGAKDDAVHVVGFIPNATAIDIRPESPFLRSFRTASNLLGVFQLEQPNSKEDELKLRIAYAANNDTPLDDLRFGPDDFISGLESLEHPAARKSSEVPFIAKFPNDIRVEFVGLSRGVGDIKAADKWWRPDGLPLQRAPEYRGASGVLKDGEVESEDPHVRTVIHVHGIGDNNAVTATAAIQTAESMKDESGGQYVAHHGYTDAPARTRTFEVGVATEVISPKRWLDRDGKRIESKLEPGNFPAKDLIAEDITIEKVGLESWGKGATSKGGMKDPVGPGDQKMGSLSGTTQVTIRFPLAWRNVDLRLFAIDKSGNSHGVDMTVTLDPNDENATYKRLAKTFPVDYSEVDHFEYQFRVYRHWAIFENVSLFKGTQTEVVMKSETVPQTQSDEVSQKAASSTSNETDIERKVLAILRTPFIEDPEKGTWQLGAHDIDVQWKLRDLPQRVEVIKTLFKVVDRSVPSSMYERLLAMEFLGGADPKNLVPRLNKEIENALANLAKPFTAYHEIEILGRMGEDARSSLPVLIKLLDSTDGVAYNLALDSLTKIGARSPDVMNELAKHTDDPVTVYQLGRYGSMAKVHGPLFVQLLDSPSNEIHNYAALALVKTGFDEARGYDVLIADVAAGKSVDRCRAATALAALGSQAKEMLPRLRPFENDPDPQVAKAVRDAIVRIEKDDRIFTHAEVAAKREKALEISAALNPQVQFDLRIVGGEEQTPIAGIEIIATDGYGDAQKKFGPFLPSL